VDLRSRAGPLAVAVAVAGFAALAAPVLVGMPLRGGAPQLRTVREIWLLSVFTAGMLALLVAAAVALGGGVPGRAARRGLARLAGTARKDEEEEPSTGHGVAARWMAESGGWLLLIYMAGWLTTR
jgi:hypothetical protein